MQPVGRNDPCPCGSGKKYKKCHGAESAAPQLEAWKRVIQMDQRLMTQVAKHGAARFAAEGFDPFFLEPEDAQDHAHEHGEDCHHEVLFADVSFPLALYCDTRFGQTVAAHFLEQKGKYLPADERAWLRAQGAAEFSLWQLTGLGADHEVTLKNRLDGRELTLIDGDMAKEGKKGDLLLARLVSAEGVAPVVTAVHPEVIEAKDADAAVLQVQQLLKEAPGAAKQESYAAQLALVDAWHDFVYDDEESSAQASDEQP